MEDLPNPCPSCGQIFGHILCCPVLIYSVATEVLKYSDTNPETYYRLSKEYARTFRDPWNPFSENARMVAEEVEYQLECQAETSDNSRSDSPQNKTAGVCPC